MSFWKQAKKTIIFIFLKIYPELDITLKNGKRESGDICNYKANCYYNDCLKTQMAHSFARALGELCKEQYSYLWFGFKEHRFLFTWLFLFLFSSLFFVFVGFFLNINQMYSLSSKCPAEITVMGMWFSWHSQVTS